MSGFLDRLQEAPSPMAEAEVVLNELERVVGETCDVLLVSSATTWPRRFAAGSMSPSSSYPGLTSKRVDEGVEQPAATVDFHLLNSTR